MMVWEEDKTAEDAPHNEFEKLFEASIKQPVEGEVVKGTVVQANDDYVVVDIGYKSEGQVPAREFKDQQGNLTVKSGDEVNVYVEKKEGEDGLVVLSKLKADQMEVWDRLIEAHDQEKPVKGVISQRVKGGFYVDLDSVMAFLPGSQADIKPVRNPEELLGKEFDFKILKYNRRKNNIIVSRRALLEKEREAMRKETLKTLEEGVVMEGIVKNITDYGAFIDLGGIDGLVHLTDMSWGKISHPTQMLDIGDKVEVKVLKFNREEEKISLGIKQTKPDPWETAKENYPVGTKADGKVVNITDYGAFVELEEGLEGLIHISEMAWTKIKHPSQKLAVGDKVEVMILDIDVPNRRISLGLKQTEPNPWDDAEERYPRGTVIKGVVKNITDFGAFVGVEEGIDGLVHISDISWKKIKHPSEVFQKGQEVEAVVLNIDAENKRFSLSTKLLERNPWEGIEERYKPGMIVEGVITSIADFGAFVELEEGIEGLVHVSEINRGAQKESDLKVGDKVEVEVLNVDPEDNKIGLSIRSVVAEEAPAGEEPAVSEAPEEEAAPEAEETSAEEEPSSGETGQADTEKAETPEE